MNLAEMRVYTVQEVADLLRVDHNTIRRRISAGELEAIRVGDTFRIPETALIDYLTRATAAAKTG